MDPKNILREISPEMLSKHKENAKGMQNSQNFPPAAG